MHRDISRLWDLQTIDLKITELQHEVERIPIRRAEVDGEIAKLGDLSARADEGVKDLERRIRAEEKEVESLRTRQTRLKQQQMEVKKNEEYRAILEEIGYVDKQIGEKEDFILDLMEQVEVARREAVETARRLREDSARLAQESSRLDDAARFLQDESENLKRRREGTLGSVPADMLRIYTKLANGLGGIAVAEVREEICQVCHVRLRPQAYQELRTTDKFMQCESCSRILYCQNG